MRSWAMLILLLAPSAGCLDDGEEPPRLLPPPSELLCVQPCGSVIDAPALPTTEVNAAVDPVDPAHIVVGATTFANTGPGDSRWLYAYVTRDGGMTWSATRIPGGVDGAPDHPLASYTRATAPAVTVLSDGTVVMAGLALAGGSAGMALAERRALFIARSADGGSTFDDVEVLVENTGALLIAPAVEQLVGPWDLPDRGLLARGPDDELLLVWSRVRNADGGLVGLTDLTLFFAASTDGGRTWTEPAELAPGFGAAPLVRSDGAWLVAHNVASGEESTLTIEVSTDRGSTWEAHGLGPAAPFPYASLALRAAGAGDQVALAYALDVEDSRWPVLRSSPDGGANWSEPRVLARIDAPDRTQVHPTVAWDGSGFLHVAWSEPANDTDTYRARALALRACTPDEEACEDGWRMLGPLPLEGIVTTGHWSYQRRASVGLPAASMHLWMTGSFPDLDVRSVKARLG